VVGRGGSRTVWSEEEIRRLDRQRCGRFRTGATVFRDTSRGSHRHVPALRRITVRLPTEVRSLSYHPFVRVLVLGGTAEGRLVADRLHHAGVDVISSLAGRVSRPRLPAGRVRIGGFGGVDGLAAYIPAEGITHIVDATHPFAATMSGNAVAAAARTGVPVLRYARPGWGSRPDATSWHWVPDVDTARRVAESLGERPFLSMGRQSLPSFTSWGDRRVLVRVVEPLTGSIPSTWTVIEDRGPYTVDGELAMLRRHAVDVVLTKDSGGTYTSAKLDAAAALGVPVVVLARPSGRAGATEVTTVDACLDILRIPVAAR